MEFVGRKWRVAKVLRKEVLRLRKASEHSHGQNSEAPSTMDGSLH